MKRPSPAPSLRCSTPKGAGHDDSASKAARLSSATRPRTSERFEQDRVWCSSRQAHWTVPGRVTSSSTVSGAAKRTAPAQSALSALRASRRAMRPTRGTVFPNASTHPRSQGAVPITTDLSHDRGEQVPASASRRKRAWVTEDFDNARGLDVGQLPGRGVGRQRFLERQQDVLSAAGVRAIREL